MPFQVSFSVRQRQFNQVELITAGEDQTHICTPTIHLEATVEGDMLGHTLEWEQIGGTSVVLQQAGTLTPFFDFVDGTDKIFRLWIDRGTPYEQNDSVRIYKTPTSFCLTSFKHDNPTPYFNFTLDPIPVDAATITSAVEVSIPPPTSLEGEELGSTTTITVGWQHPGDSFRDNYIAQYKVIENGIEVDSLPDVPIPTAGDGNGLPSEPLTYVGQLATYRIDTYYNIAGQEYVRESGTVDFTGLTIPSVKGYNDTFRGAGKSNDLQYFTKTVYANIVQRSEASAYASKSNDLQYLSRTVYTNITLLGESSVAGTGFNSNLQYINITRYDPSGIGGG